MEEEMRRKCYKCKYRREVPGSAHSRCGHPIAKSKESKDPFFEVMSIFASVGRTAPTIDLDAAKQLKITADELGIKKGWFNWPLNFDPIWLLNCDGFIEVP